MKSLISILFVVFLDVCLATAQAGLNKGPVVYIPTTDVQGAHELGGRGCAGCHAPHSGGRGSGGATIAQTLTAGGIAEGDFGLWGTDTAAITNAGVFTFDNTYTVSLSGLTWNSGALYQGVVTCLSCHDGNISRGSMMTGQSYEQVFGLLNFASNSGINNSVHGANLYGTEPIPTLLGNDFGVPGDYNNDHPLGPLANLGRVGVAALASGLTFAANGNVLTMVIVPGSNYANFVATYGTPALSAMASDGSGIAGNLYVVCTTCHNQHVMNVYSSTEAGGTPIASGAVTSAQTIFFVRGPYNPGAAADPNHVPSTNAFCLQCHFDHASQYFGSTTVGTAF
jgi:hypothetical protein